MLPEPYSAIEKTTNFTIHNIQVIVIPQPYSNAMSYRHRVGAFLRFAIRASLQTIKHPTDVIFATSTPLTIAIPAILGRFWHRKPMVFEVRDLWPEVPIAVGALKNPVARLMAQGLERITYMVSFHIIALSPGMKAGIVQTGTAEEKITVIPNACDIDLFGVPPESGHWVRENLNLTSDQPLIVYTGTFGHVNTPDYLVKIAALLSETSIHFLLIGSGAEKDHVTQLAQENGTLGNNVTIWNPIPKTKIADVLAAATIATSTFLPLPALENNSANKFFDALAAGTSVAINYKGWQADILREIGAGIVLPYDDIPLAAQQLHDFVSDPERLQQASQAARTLAETQFARDLLFEKLHGILLDTANVTG
jgi:glycosyltransferase involved in cell wall biosynthesis